MTPRNRFSKQKDYQTRSVADRILVIVPGDNEAGLLDVFCSGSVSRLFHGREGRGQGCCKHGGYLMKTEALSDARLASGLSLRANTLISPRNKATQEPHLSIVAREAVYALMRCFRYGYDTTGTPATVTATVGNCQVANSTNLVGKSATGITAREGCAIAPSATMATLNN